MFLLDFDALLGKLRFGLLHLLHQLCMGLGALPEHQQMISDIKEGTDSKQYAQPNWKLHTKYINVCNTIHSADYGYGVNENVPFRREMVDL